MKASYACYLPGQWTTICSAEGDRVDKLHFCGEHTSVDFQGYMEGGCESGTRVADEILVDLGLKKPEKDLPVCRLNCRANVARLMCVSLRSSGRRMFSAWCAMV